MTMTIPTFRRCSGISIPRTFETQSFYQDIKRDLTRRVKQYNSDCFVTNHYYIETDKSLLIPRYFPINRYIECNVEDIMSYGEDIEIENKIEPRDDVQRVFMRIMTSETSGLIQLEPGVGKTIITIYALSTIKKKAIILVHRSSLVQQWAERITFFTSITNDQIGIINSRDYKKALQKPICISTAQSFLSALNRKGIDFLIELNKANIGVFVGDEVHTSIGAPTFSECSIHIPTKINFGLSATPKRIDGNSDIINYHVGKLYKDEDIGSTINARVTTILVDFDIDNNSRQRYLHWEGKFQRSRYLNILKNSKTFVTIVESLIDKISSHSIIMCERINLIDKLYDYCKIDDKSKFISGEDNDVLKKRMTFTTPGKMRDGVDAPWKDTVVLTSPISNIKQMCGRIVRPYRGKEESVIIDIVDIGSKDIRRTFHGRLDFYKEREWDIRYIFIDKNMDKHIIDEKQAINIIKGE